MPKLTESLQNHIQLAIAVLAMVAIVTHLLLRFLGLHVQPHVNWPLYATLALDGVPLVLELLVKLLRREFGSDLLAGISIVTAVTV